MKTIWKIVLDRSVTRAELPEGADFLSVGPDPRASANVVAWFAVDTERATETRAFQIVGTGQELPDGESLYLGSVIQSPFVWHVFELFSEVSRSRATESRF